MEGVVRFLDDLHLDPSSRIVLIIAWKFKAAQQCEFSREEFIGTVSSVLRIRIPHGSAVILVGWIRIQIRIVNTDPDPGGST
jgi:hypothetical protein